jgi:cold shock protein
MSEFVTGEVKWFSSEKGYGFVLVDGKDIFIHSKRLRESGFSKDSANVVLETGDKLKFKIEDGPKGAFATEISKG